MRAPVLAVGDGALGFWAALRDVFPETKEQRCWVHKIARVLDALPKSMQPKAKAALHEIMNAENKEAAEMAMDRFQETYGAKYQKATERLLKDREVLLTHFAYLAEHWVHLAARMPSSRRSRRSGCGPTRPRARAAGARAWPWPTSCWRPPRRAGAASTRPTWSRSVRAGATFVDGVKVEREDRRSAA
jgi:putative transposase